MCITVHEFPDSFPMEGVTFYQGLARLVTEALGVSSPVSQGRLGIRDNLIWYFPWIGGICAWIACTLIIDVI